ncbi:MAG: hypothetical protein KJO24_07150 [Gammaproteobacteria bacterium]|nr:hypothetical protein [Gammaproteobacteria bacterium]
MVSRIKYLQLLVVFSLCTSQGAAGFSFEIPVSEAMANKLAQAYFPQVFTTGSLDLFAEKPRVFMLEGNRVGLSAFLSCRGRCGGGSGVASAKGSSTAHSEGAALVSAAIDFNAESRELVLIDPAIDSLVFFKQNQASREASKAIYENWQRHISNPTLIATEQLGESELLTRYLQDIVVREGVAYFVYGGAGFDFFRSSREPSTSNIAQPTTRDPAGTAQ